MASQPSNTETLKRDDTPTELAIGDPSTGATGGAESEPTTEEKAPPKQEDQGWRNVVSFSRIHRSDRPW